MNKFILYAFLFLISCSCAIMNKGLLQQVYFKGGSKEHKTIVQIKNEQYSFNERISLTIPRSKNDITLNFLCADGSKKQIVLESSIDGTTVFFKNLVWLYFIIIAAPIDLLNNEAYDFNSEVDLTYICNHPVDLNKGNNPLNEFIDQ
jgi:hypothetical protein